MQEQTFLLESWAVLAKFLQQVQVSECHEAQPQAGLSKSEALSLPEVPSCPAAVFFVLKPFQSQSLLILQVQGKKLQQKMPLESLWQQPCQQLEQFLLWQIAVWEKMQREKASGFPPIPN